MTLTPEHRAILVSRIENVMRQLSLISSELCEGPSAVIESHPAYYAMNRAWNATAEARDMIAKPPE